MFLSSTNAPPGLFPSTQSEASPMVDFAPLHNSSDAINPLPESLHELLELRAAESAGRAFITVPESGQSLDFAGFSERVATLAGALVHLGMRHGSRVALLLSNGIEAAVG